MTATISLLALLVVAIILDILFVLGMRRFRRIRKEGTDETGKLTISPGELLVRAFFPFAYQRKWPGIFFEFALIAVWAMIVGMEYLNMDPRVVPVGREFGSTLQSHHLWTQFQKCGLCALWNGFERGGYPAFADIQGSMLHPLVIVTTLIWGVINGVKISLVATLWCAGLAQWWIAHELKLGWLPRLWSAGIAVAGGHLSGRMELGVFGMVLSTAMGSLLFAGILHLDSVRSGRGAVLLGVLGAFVIVSGQGSFQVGLLGILPAALILIFDEHRNLAPHWKYYVLAFALSLLLAAPLLIPLIHFAPNITKDTDAAFRSTQPLQYFVLNLVINDEAYYKNALLDKYPYPYLYTLYIGWVPVLLAIFGITPMKHERRPTFLFLLVGIVLCFLIASAVLLKPLVKIFPSIAGFRHPPQIGGLAIPLILAFSAYGLERLMNLPGLKPVLNLYASKPWSGLLTYRWMLLIPLFLSLKSVYQFSQLWLVTDRWGSDIYQSLQALKTDSMQWVELPFGEHKYKEPAIDLDLKISPSIMTWAWRGREYPVAMRSLSKGGIPPGSIIPSGIIHGLRIFDNAEETYAAVYSGAHRSICKAQGSGGFIRVSCKNNEPGILTLKEYTWSGWHVWVDGKATTLEPDETWLEVKAPAGTHTYTFRYLPWDVPLGILLTICGLIACAYLWRVQNNPKAVEP